MNPEGRLCGSLRTPHDDLPLTPPGDEHCLPAGGGAPAHTLLVRQHPGAHAISLFSYRIGSRELLVVPPSTDPRRANLLMAATLLADGPERADVPRRGRIRVRTWRGRGGTGPVLPVG